LEKRKTKIRLMRILVYSFVATKDRFLPMMRARARERAMGGLFGGGCLPFQDSELDVRDELMLLVVVVAPALHVDLEFTVVFAVEPGLRETESAHHQSTSDHFFRDQSEFFEPLRRLFLDLDKRNEIIFWVFVLYSKDSVDDPRQTPAHAEA